MTSIAAPAPDVRVAADWGRKYPPLLAIGVGLLIAAMVLPSSLNLPQTNPTETVEYAPVPPDETLEDPPPSNFAQLGLGTSEGVEGEGASGGEGEGGGPIDEGAPPAAEDPGAGKNPTTYRCVGDPPRQTEDPLAPPCVPFFDGDNFGATYQGVTRDEIRILIFIDGGINYISGSDGGTDNVAPSNEYFDLFQAPDEDGEHFLVRGMRSWQRYFTERFQTYKRRPHFFVYFSGCVSGGCAPEERRADAADNYQTVKPFAVVSTATEGAEDAYLEAMSKKGVLNFGAYSLRPESFFQRFAKLIWSYDPSIEYHADSYTSFICKKVIGQPSVLAGPDLNNRERKIGILHTTDRNHPGLIQFADITKKRVEECGGTIADTATYEECCLAQDNGDTGTYAQTQMARFKQEGITTILWPGGIHGNYGKSATALNYHPEWIVLGDGLLDANNPVRLSQNSEAFDRRAIVVTPQTFLPGLEQQRCYQAYREVDQEMSRPNLGYLCDDYYKILFQLFVGIQVAGPRLGPTSIDKGFHAIPAVPSTDVQTPSCFYEPGDYTCVKDAEFEIWHADGRAPGDNRPGCWAAILGGKRFLSGDWPEGNIDAQVTGNEPCNGYSASVRFNAA